MKHHRQPTPSLWRSPDFLKLWSAQTVSLFGSEITTLALPLAAVLLLKASPFQMGLLAAFGKLPFLLLSLFAGIWIDRVRRRPVLIAADLGRALLLLSVPVAAWLGALSLQHLYIVAGGVGALSVYFEIAHMAYVPLLVSLARLVEGNSKIQASYSVAESSAPAVAGLLVQVVSAPLAVLADVFSFVVSALLLSRLRVHEPRPVRPEPRASLRQSIHTGLRALVGHPVLRSIIVCSAISELFMAALLAIYVLYLAQELQFGPATIGVIFAVGGASAIAGAAISGRVARRLGVGRAIMGGWLLEGLGLLLVPLAVGPAALPLLLLGQALVGGAGAVANIHQWTFRQAVTPDHLQGRVTASHRFVVYGAASLGALLGGSLGALLGLWPALVVCGLCGMAGRLYALWSPLHSLREQPAEPEPNTGLMLHAEN